jgi:pyrroloquinoline-quinone synthase
VTITDEIDSIVACHRLLDHPFYATWARGELTRPALERYAEQYFHWVSAFPTFLSAIHARCRDIQARQTILENLCDEERGPNNHPELWLRFCDALGLNRDEVRGVTRLSETEEAIARYRRLCDQAAPAAALAAVYAYESQQPAVMGAKRGGLVKHYGVATGLEYFTVHETLDVHHSVSEGALIERLATQDDRPTIVHAVRVGLAATITLLDGVYDEYVDAG